MNKLLMSAAMAAMFGAMIPAAQAATVNSGFAVRVNLTAVCTATTVGTPAVDFGVYTAFTGPATAAPTAAVTFNCTRGLATPTVAFDTGTGYGVIAGLNYNLTASAPVIAAGSAATAVLGGTGTADGYTYTITGSMAAGQAGACVGTTATACAGVQSQARTLIVTY